MKLHSFGYSLLSGLLLTVMSVLASPVAQSATLFDAGAARSEQLGFSAFSPQIIGSATSDTLTITWQGYEGNNPSAAKLIQYNRAGGSYTKAWEKQLPLPRLVGMTGDGSNFYVVTSNFENMSQDKNPNVFRTNVLIMTKFDGKGNQIWQRDLNNADYLKDTTGAVYSPMIFGSGSVAFGGGKLLVTLSSNTAPDANGLRHQRAQIFVVGTDGNAYRAASETSWRHSFDQRLLFDGQDFIFTDLGDASWYMPAAGITVRKIRPTANGADFIGGGENLQGTYIYARQGDTTGSQNFGFTSIGGLEAGAQGYLALFTSEKSNPTVMRDGFSQPVAEPRNLGFVHVTRNFETVREGLWNGSPIVGNTIIDASNTPVKINITRNVVDSNGPSNEFKRADKLEKSFVQTGVVWLTNLPAGVSAERSKLIKLANGRFVALWEEWSYNGTDLNFLRTKGMIINEQAQPLTAAVELKARLNPSGADRAFVLDGKAAWITGDAKTGLFSLFTVDTNLGLAVTAIDPSGLPQPATFVDHLSPGDTLKPNDKLVSNNGRFKLVYQTDSNLALYTAEGKFIWNTGTTGAAGRAVMQTDGNFAIYTADGKFQWNTGTTTAGSKLVLQDDGNLLIVTPAGATIWSTNTGVRDRLKAGERLNPGDKLQSANGKYNLVYQTDGNLALYTADGRFLWNTGTKGPAGSAIMQTDGNFAIYTADGKFQWNTGTVSPGSFIVVQTDGNIVVYSAANVALWASNTVQP